MVRTLISWISAGALLGLFLASAIGPPVMGWYNTPGGTSPQQTICNYAEITENITRSLLKVQVEGAAAGALVFLIIGIVVEVRKKKKQSPPVAPATA